MAEVKWPCQKRVMFSRSGVLVDDHLLEPPGPQIVDLRLIPGAVAAEDDQVFFAAHVRPAATAVDPDVANPFGPRRRPGPPPLRSSKRSTALSSGMAARRWASSEVPPNAGPAQQDAGRRPGSTFREAPPQPSSNVTGEGVAAKIRLRRRQNIAAAMSTRSAGDMPVSMNNQEVHRCSFHS